MYMRDMLICIYDIVQGERNMSVNFCTISKVISGGALCQEKHRILTLMGRTCCIDLLFEGDPSLVEFICSPCVPTLINETCPLNVVLRVKIQARNPMCVIKNRQADLIICIPVYKCF